MKRESMRRRGRLEPALRTLWLVVAPFLAAVGPVDESFWQRQNIYQIITDRFYDGDRSNNNADGNYDPSGRWSVHGGDFKGIEEKLDYIKALGASAIWISPVVVNARGEFHGYAGRDFYRVDPHWGSMADLRHLIQAAHGRGMLVIDDVVVNHGGTLIDSGDPGYPDFKYAPGGYHLRFRNPARQYPPPFNTNAANPALTNLFHNNGVIQDYDDPIQVQLGQLSGLDDFRTETPYVRSQMTKIYEYWIEQAGFDGFRIDTVKHVEMGFWQTWCPAIHRFAAEHGKPNFFLFGEVLDRSDPLCGSYSGTKGGGPFKLDSLLDYPLYFKMRDIFAAGTGGTKQIGDHYAAVSTNYDPAAQMRLVTFLDNHDQPRFLSEHRAGGVDRLKVALVFLYTCPGIPCLYYGTEQGFDGARDPFDREDMFAGQFEWGPSRGDNFDMTHPLFQWVARLNNFRRLYPALELGTCSVLWSTPQGPGLFACARRLGQREVLVIFNTAAASQTLPGCPILSPAGATLRNLLAPNDAFTVLPGGRTPPVTVAGASAKIFVDESQQRPLDPVVIRISPAHDSAKVAPASSIVIEFSDPMNPQSVESAFSLVPAIKGAFFWSPACDRVEFRPAAGGLPSQTMMKVIISDQAQAAASRLRLRAAFESRFKTGRGGN